MVHLRLERNLKYFKKGTSVSYNGIKINKEGTKVISLVLLARFTVETLKIVIPQPGGSFPDVLKCWCFEVFW